MILNSPILASDRGRYPRRARPHYSQRGARRSRWRKHLSIRILRGPNPRSRARHGAFPIQNRLSSCPIYRRNQKNCLPPIFYALWMSMEEEAAWQAAANPPPPLPPGAAAPTAGGSTATTAAAGPGGMSAQAAARPTDENEETILQQTLALSEGPATGPDVEMRPRIGRG